MAAHKENLLNWAPLVKTLLFEQSSAFAERAFSLLVNAFGPQQKGALQDYLEACVMIQYNSEKRL